MKTITVCNQKGGVGKSTTTYHLTRAAVLEGLRVLVIDMDPQGNITANLTVAPLPEDSVGVADVIAYSTDDTLEQVVVPTVWPGADLAPTPNGNTLESVRDSIVGKIGREMRMAFALRAVTEAYDLVVIDCPPSLDMLTINALVAADDVLIVTQPEQWSLSGLANLRTTIQQIKDMYNARLGITGIVVNMYDKRTTGDGHWLQELDTYVEQNGIRKFETPVPRRVAVRDTVAASVGLDEWKVSDTAELQSIYTGFVKEILK